MRTTQNRKLLFDVISKLRMVACAEDHVPIAFAVDEGIVGSFEYGGISCTISSST